LFLAALLLGYLMRPVRHLTKAAHDLAQQRFPEPIPIPSGNDELTQLAQSFNRMSHAVRGFLERERSFTRYASHELRTPLATLRAQIEAMQRGLVSQAEAMPHLEAGLRRIEDILNGLLTLTRSPEPDPHPLNLHALVQSVVAGMPPSHRSRVEVTLEGETWTIGPRELVNQAVSNLLENACKYSQGPVRVHLGKIGQEVFVQVRDQGPGVPEEALARLGEPFLRLNPQVQGLGLGLALVRHIARSLSGNVRFRNLRPGLEVTLSLPKAAPPREETHARNATRT
jgi:signal transduction histidine kinase